MLSFLLVLKSVFLPFDFGNTEHEIECCESMKCRPMRQGSRIGADSTMQMYTQSISAEIDDAGNN